MTAIAVKRETSNYWNLIKDAGNEVKLALITLLSSSMAKDQDMCVTTEKTKARRLDRIADEDMEKMMTGEPIPITDDGKDTLTDIVNANKGRILKGMEKWL